jgi:hypothetical protein
MKNEAQGPLTSNRGMTGVLLAVSFVIISWCNVSFADVAFDTSAQGFGSSISIARGTSAGDYIGIVHVECAIGRTVSAATWGGQSMTHLLDETNVSGSRGYVYYLVNPASGTSTVAVTTSGGNCTIGAITYSGVDQSVPFDTNFDGAGHSYSATVNGSVANNAQLTTSGTTHVDGSLPVTAIDYNVGVAAGTNATERLHLNIYDTGAPTSTGSVSLGILNNSGGSEGIAGFMFALQPAH